MPLILYRVLNFSSHSFKALKFSSSICSATATAFDCSMGPETGMFLVLAILKHSNIAESICLDILALLLAPYPFVQIYQAISACHVGWIESVFYHIETSTQFLEFRSLDFCLCRQLHLLFFVKLNLSVSSSPFYCTVYRLHQNADTC